MTELVERVGASLRRAPYVWLALTILLYLMLSQPVSTIVTRPRDANTPIAIAAAFIVALGVVGSLVVVPRVLLPRSRANTSDDRIAVMRWGFAGFPVVVGISAVAFGGQPWAFVLGSFVSMALTVHAARTIHRAA